MKKTLLSRILKAVVVTGVFSVVATVPARAELVGGVWSLSDVLSASTCEMELLASSAENGLGNAITTGDCQKIYGEISKVSAWRWDYEEGLSLLSDEGDQVLQFDLDELDGLTSVKPESRFLILEPLRSLTLSSLIRPAYFITAQR
ncbi:hypothetical protein E1162_06535 [Rhodobacteraceae bacterium RKSG542]|uniref:AprI/Inh family metalloprotease inhibitor n=1 Tax=Pseudovibrio flavus TaxID=2529854 RepID=UPI0012BC4E2F|nr:AprI/Inh family metalloprotease inhibitor [Pseudovibrio flavus]MTI16891.1 hypothetical protein [Pseudovibrio flavus]